MVCCDGGDLKQTSRLCVHSSSRELPLTAVWQVKIQQVKPFLVWKKALPGSHSVCQTFYYLCDPNLFWGCPTQLQNRIQNLNQFVSPFARGGAEGLIHIQCIGPIKYCWHPGQVCVRLQPWLPRRLCHSWDYFVRDKVLAVLIFVGCFCVFASGETLICLVER